MVPPHASGTAFPRSQDFEAIGFAIMHRGHTRAGEKTRMRRFKSWFGAEPVFMSITWRKLQQSGWLDFAGKRPKPEHLLWALMWLKCHHVEDVGASIAGVDEKTWREKVWFCLEGTARLDAAVASSDPSCREHLLLSFKCSHAFDHCCCRCNGKIASSGTLDSVALCRWMVLTFQSQSPHLGRRFGGLTNSMVQVSGMSL